jgi:hypothetical protein
MCEPLAYSLAIISFLNVGCTSPRPAHRQTPIDDFFGGKFLSFCEQYFEKECSIKNSTFELKNY